MAPRKTTFLDLPLELFRAILVEAVRIRGLKRALRLRLVSRLFSEELTEALCASGLSNQCNVALSKMPFVRPYLEKRLLEHRTTGLILLNTVHRTAERLATQDGDSAKFKEYALSLLQLAVRVGGHEVAQLLLPGRGYWEPEGFKYELLTAAAYTNDISRVKSLVGWSLGWKAGIFGNPYKAALAGRNFDILNLLFEDIHAVGIRQKHRLLQEATESGDKEAAELILHADWSPCNNLENERRPVDLEYALQTPSIEIFDMVMQEREKFYPNPLTLNTLKRLIRAAAYRGWVDMAKHLIALGAPPEWELTVESAQPLYYACKTGQDDIAKLLLDYRVYTSGVEMQAAASHGHASTLTLLLEHGVYIHSAGAKNCIAAAAAKGHLATVRALLDAGMDPNEGSIVPMVEAVRAEHPGICQLLTERGATMTVTQAIAEVARKELAY